PLAHPVQPKEYAAIDNFYTATVYEKGAEIIRMMQTLLGEAAFSKGMELYFDRFDGTAATIEDFMGCMAEAGDRDLSGFRRWYDQAGLPRVKVQERYDAAAQTLSLSFEQDTPATPAASAKEPFEIPIQIGFAAETAGGAPGLEDRLIVLTETSAQVDIKCGAPKPAVSLLRGFSAPVRLERDLAERDRRALMRGDGDLFNRWEAMREASLSILQAVANGAAFADQAQAVGVYADALAESLADETLEHAYRAELLLQPSPTEIAQTLEVIDPAAIQSAHSAVRQALAERLQGVLSRLHDSLAANAPYSPDAASAGRRALRNAALDLLLALEGPEPAQRALAQAAAASNMTDEAAAVSALARAGRPEKDEALAAFYEKWREEPLIVNKWLAWRAADPSDDPLARVRSLTTHPAYDVKTPNKVRAVLATFSAQNMAGFHRPDGEAYGFFIDQLLAIDALNPTLAARLATGLETWPRFEPARRALLRQAVDRLAGADGLSANLSDVAQRLRPRD
ncbi:MAG: DUF3458 domain-containing protein, partial [Pseudomonadota bacterium]